MHPQGYGDVTGLAKRGMLCRIVPFAEVINTITENDQKGADLSEFLAEECKHLQVPDNDVCRRRWVVSGHSYVPARLMAGLSQLPNRVALHWYIGTRNLDQC